jgi:hypothetical protein
MSGSSILRSFYPIVGTKTTLRWTFVNIGGNRWTFMSWCYDWRMSFSVSHFALLDEVPRDSPHSFVILHRSDCLDCFCLVLESRLELNHDIFSLRCYPVFFFYFAFEERSSLHPALYASCWHCASERVHSLPRIAQSEPLRSASWLQSRRAADAVPGQEIHDPGRSVESHFSTMSCRHQRYALLAFPLQATASLFLTRLGFASLGPNKETEARPPRKFLFHP